MERRNRTYIPTQRKRN